MVVRLRSPLQHPQLAAGIQRGIRDHFQQIASLM